MSDAEPDEDEDDDAQHGYDEAGIDVPANDPHEPTQAEREASQDRMQAEANAAKSAYEARQAEITEAVAFDQEVAALNAAATGAAYAEALDQEVRAQNLEVMFDPNNLAPTLREQMLGEIDEPLNDAQLRDLNGFLVSDAGYAAAEQYELALEIANLPPDEKIEAMRAATLEPVLVADLTGAVPASALQDHRTASQVAADYAQGLNETLADIANSRWSWAAGIAFDAVALAAGGPVKFAVSEVAGRGAAALLETGVDAAADYIAERTELEPEEVAHLAIAGGTIIGGVVLGWNGVKQTIRNLPDTVQNIRTRIDNFRRDESGSIPGGATRPRFERTDEEYEDLARDPSHNLRISPASQAERDVGLGLEERGEVSGPIRRDSSGGAEFIDADGLEWDVKAYNSSYPNGFDIERIEGQLDMSRRLGENVMMDTRNLSPDDLASLRELVDANDFGEMVRFWP